MLPVFHETLFNNYQGNNSNRLFRTSYKMWFSGKKTLKHVSLLCIKKHQVALQHTKQQRRKKTMQDIWVDTGISLAAIPFPTPINVTALTPPHPPTPYELPRASSTYPPPSTTHIPKSNQQSLSRLLTTNKGNGGRVGGIFQSTKASHCTGAIVVYGLFGMVVAGRFRPKRTK